MPIRPENLHHYQGKTWQHLRQEVLARAGNRCEGSPAYPDCRAENGKPHPVTGSRVVLTTAHLDHDPTNNNLTNLRSWCQRCHNTYDAPMRAAGIRARREPVPVKDSKVTPCELCGISDRDFCGCYCEECGKIAGSYGCSCP